MGTCFAFLGPMKRLAILIPVLALVSGACSVSQDQEAQMGQQTAQEVEAQLPIVNDAYINSYINELGDTIANHTSRADLQWHFYIVNSHQVNAFALPGGYIYVNRGLIESADRADELAGVLGHEIGHVILRHSVKQMQQQEKLSVAATLACTLTNICKSGLGQAAINVGGTALISRYSRKDELQADSEAVENVLHVNIDPEGIPALFEVLMEQRKTQPTIVDGWFSTHPLEESRIQQARHLIQAKGADQTSGLMQDLPSYAAFRKAVSSLPEPPAPPPQGQ